MFRNDILKLSLKELILFKLYNRTIFEELFVYNRTIFKVLI